MLDTKMLDRRVKPVRDVTRGIRAVERACEAMVAGAAQLAIDMLAAGEACKLPVDAGQEALERVNAIITAGLAARAVSARAHQALALVGQSNDAPIAWGDDCPPPPPNIEESDRVQALRLVG